MVICLERGADLHMAQLMPLPLTVSCFSKIQIGFTSAGGVVSKAGLGSEVEIWRHNKEYLISDGPIRKIIKYFSDGSTSK